jgi:hypothetical protein
LASFRNGSRRLRRAQLSQSFNALLACSLFQCQYPSLKPPQRPKTPPRGFVDNSEYRVAHKPHRAPLRGILAVKFHTE